MATIVIEKYSPAQLDAAVSVLSNAFVTNPLHISAFGPQRIDQNRLFFRIGLRHMFIGEAFVALKNKQVRGYMHFNASPHCLPAPEEIPTAATTLLGPLGVAPEAQGEGIGSALMNRYIEHMKGQRAAGYLETDRLQNVEFYKKFGFIVRHEEQLIGTTTWYMWRSCDRAT